MAADLATAPDEAFAGEMMGKGAVVSPTDGRIVAPEDGEITMIFDTKHAVGMITDSKIELLIHVGIDTVALDGKGFEVFVKEGQHVKKGETLIKADLEYIEKNAKSIVTPVICTQLEDNQTVKLVKTGQIKAGESLFVISYN